MTWAKLLANNTVTAFPSTKAELTHLRSIVARSPKDVRVAALSADARFIMAYDAARAFADYVRLATAPERSAGITTPSLPWRSLIQPLPPCRPISTAAGLSAMLRSTTSRGGVSDTDADGLLKTVQQFGINAEAWVKTHHPKLA